MSLAQLQRMWRMPELDASAHMRARDNTARALAGELVRTEAAAIAAELCESGSETKVAASMVHEHLRETLTWYVRSGIDPVVELREMARRRCDGDPSNIARAEGKTLREIADRLERHVRRRAGQSQRRAAKRGSR